MNLYGVYRLTPWGNISENKIVVFIAEIKTLDTGCLPMIHVTCDLCGHPIENPKAHFRVEIEIFPMQQDNPMVEEDLDQDNLEHIAMMISDPEAVEPLPALTKSKFDLCAKCAEKFQRNPLSREADSSVNFSDN